MHQPISAVDLLALDLRRSEGVAVPRVVDGEAGERRRHQVVVAVEHAAQRVEDLGAHLLVGEILRTVMRRPISSQCQNSGGKSS